MWGWLTGSSSAAKPKEVTEAEKSFSKQELNAITLHFKELARTSGTAKAGQRGLTQDVFVTRLCGLPASQAILGQALFDVVRSCMPGRSAEQLQYYHHQIGGPQDCVTLEEVVIAKARCERLGDDVAAAFCFSVLAAVSGLSPAARAIGAAQLHSGLAACARLALGQAAPPHLIDAVVAGALLAANSGSRELTVDGYQRWAKEWPAFHLLLGSLLKGVGRPEQVAPAASQGAGHGGAVGAVSAQPTASTSARSGGGAEAAAAATAAPSAWLAALPELRDLPPRASPADLLLTQLWTWMLCSCLPPDLRQEWRLLFSSQFNGKSFNTMMGRLASCEGPSLVLVKDKDGHTFGGFAPVPWRKAGAFFGDFSTFIFGLLPVTQMFKATGINENFLWCGVGFSQLPNGIGFGGAQGPVNRGAFAVYVDDTLDAGMSRPIATFGNVSLSAKQVFEVSVVECWQLKPNADEDEQADGSSKGTPAHSSSVLDKKAQDKNFMDIAGVGSNHSAGLRSEAPIED